MSDGSELITVNFIELRLDKDKFKVGEVVSVEIKKTPPKPKGGLRVYYTSIYLHSEGRLELFGAFKSWKAFAESLGKSRTNVHAQGTYLDKGNLYEWALAHPESSWEAIGDGYRGDQFAGVIPIKCWFRTRYEHKRGATGAVDYIKANEGTLKEDM